MDTLDTLQRNALHAVPDTWTPWTLFPYSSYTRARDTVNAEMGSEVSRCPNANGACGHTPDSRLLQALNAIFAEYLDGPLQLAGRCVVARFKVGTPTAIKQAFAGALRHSRSPAQRAQRQLALVARA